MKIIKMPKRGLVGPYENNEPKKLRSVTLSDNDMNKAYTIGDSNASKGIRVSLEYYFKNH